MEAWQAGAKHDVPLVLALVNSLFVKPSAQVEVDRPDAGLAVYGSQSHLPSWVVRLSVSSAGDTLEAQRDT